MENIAVLEDYNVITNDLLKKCVYLPPPVSADDSSHDGSGGGLVSKDIRSAEREQMEELPPTETVKKLSLSFQHLHEISNLDAFLHISVLQLDNNHLKKIENINHMTHLKWLDLSFNEIEKIENLDGLSELTDLSLYGNKVSLMENLDDCKKLSCLSLGNNRISKIDNIPYLRRFTYLRLLVLSGNPICTDPEHKSFALAHIPSLKYFDYQKINPAEVTAAREAHEDSLLELDERERKEAAEAEDNAVMKKEDEELTQANAEGIVSLFDDILAGDSEWPRVEAFMKLYEGLFGTFKEQFTAVVEDFKGSLLKLYSKKMEEEDEYKLALEEVKTEHDDVGKSLVTGFERKKKQVLMPWKEKLDEYKINKEDVTVLEDMLVENKELSLKLLDLETDLVEQIESVNLEYEKNIDMVSQQARDLFQNMFLRLQDIEAMFFEEQLKLVMVEFEKAQEDENVQNNYPDYVRHLFSDKDTFSNAFNSSHDNRVSQLNHKEESHQKKEKAQMAEILTEIQETEYRRDRTRVQEIWGFIDGNKGDINELLSEAEM